MPLPLTRIQLDQGQCAMPHTHDERCSQGGLYLHGACHPKAGNDVFYDKARGVLVLTCHRCEKLVVEVKVADDDGLSAIFAHGHKRPTGPPGGRF